MEKQCFNCMAVKPLSEFYRHPEMADGHLNKCKECQKEAVRLNRLKRIDHYRAYDRERGCRHPDGYITEYKNRYPMKAKAVRAINYAIASGKMKREPCEVCGIDEHVHAHHDDYAFPLTVRWLCAAHHQQWHRDNGPGLNGGEEDGDYRAPEKVT